MRIIYTFILLFTLGQWAEAQNERLYTLFVFNQLQYNPAYAGSKDGLHAGVHYRHQWQGVEGAPRTVSAFAHRPFAAGRSALGLTLTSDKIGMLNSTIASMDYAYRITFKNDHRLSLGLNVQVHNSRFDWSKANVFDLNDRNLPLDADAQTRMNAGLGGYYHSDQFYVGVSTASLLRNGITSETYRGFSRYRDFRPYHLMGGVVWKVAPNVHLRPSLLISYIRNAPLDVDFNLSVLLAEKIWLGASYRLDESVDAFVQFPIAPRLKLAVGYDYTLNDLQNYSQGSGELMLEYTFKKGNERINNIRFF